MISAIKAASRLDSRGIPTVKVRLVTDKGIFEAIVPSGASKGDYEAVELRDDDPAVFHGKGVDLAVKNVEDVIAPVLVGKFNVALHSREIDRCMIELDGTDDKGRLGANAILGVSMAVARAAAAEKGIPLYEHIRQLSGVQRPYLLPVPFFNVLNGGVHSGNLMAFQEFMIAPVEAVSMNEAVRMGSEIYQELKQVVKERYGSAAIGIGDEGGFAPPISEPREALDLLVTAVSRCKYTGRIRFAIDPASSEFLSEGLYDLGFKDPTSTRNKLSSEELGSLYEQLIKDYPIILLEDPFGQNDWEAWTAFNKPAQVELVGDDLLATNVRRIEVAEQRKACNSLLLKMNQIGTLTETIDAALLAYSYNWKVFVSHRSGETQDDFIADLVVGLGAGHLKSGSPCRGERVAKYNRLLDIEEELRLTGQDASYVGTSLNQS